MARLLVTPGELRNTSSTMAAARSQMNDILGNLKTQVNTMSTTIWDSASGRQFDQQFNSVRQNCTRALEALNTRLQSLAQAADVFDQMEQEQKQAVNQLDSSTIFN